MDQKQKRNSIEGRKKALADLAVRIEPPIELSPAETECFDSIVEGLSQTDWSEYRLRLAAQLARLTLWNEGILLELMEEGPTQKNDRGTRIANPKQNAMNANQSTIQSLTRTIGVSASQRGLSQTSTASARKAEKDAKAALDKASKSSML